MMIGSRIVLLFPRILICILSTRGVRINGKTLFVNHNDKSVLKDISLRSRFSNFSLSITKTGTFLQKTTTF